MGKARLKGENKMGISEENLEILRGILSDSEAGNSENGSINDNGDTNDSTNANSSSDDDSTTSDGDSVDDKDSSAGDKDNSKDDTSDSDDNSGDSDSDKDVSGLVSALSRLKEEKKKLKEDAEKYKSELEKVRGEVFESKAKVALEKYGLPEKLSGLLKSGDKSPEEILEDLGFKKPEVGGRKVSRFASPNFSQSNTKNSSEGKNSLSSLRKED